MKKINLIFNARFWALFLFLFSCTLIYAQDTDGDGIQNSVDLDDDNDGIPDSVECPGNNIVANGTFTTNANGWSLSGGWSATGSNVLIDANSVATADVSQSLTNLAYTNNFIPLTLTVGAQDGSNAAGSTASLQILLNGTLYATINNSATRSTTVNNITITLANGATSTFAPFTTANASGYTSHTFTLNIPNSGIPNTSTLTFRATTANDDWILDDISVLAFTCNTDGDALPNHLDLDSDNDGCFDAIEGDENVLPSQLNANGSINTSANGGIGTTVGTNNGVPNLVNSGGAADVGGDVGQAVGDSQSNLANAQCIDTDNDGIPNNIDLDDDNDGILDTVEDSCETEGTPVYINTFGTGARTSDSNVLNHTYVATGSIPDGSYSVTTSSAVPDTFSQTELIGGIDAGNPVITAGTTTGRYLMININGPGTVNLPIYRVSSLTTTVGTRYRFRIDMAGLSTGALPNLQLSLRDTSGNLLASANSGNIAMANDDVWRRLSLNFVATTASVVLEIVNLQSNGNGNDVGIDNIILAPLTICDTDGDGIPNSQDLDSDGDGCTDAIEGGANFTNANLVTATGALATQNPNQNLGNTVGNTATTIGVPTIAGTGQGTGRSQNAVLNDCIDSDGDGSPDWEDLDDDNDGILDTVECPPTSISADLTPAVITGGGTASATVSGIAFGGVTGTLTRVNNGITVISALQKTTADMSSATVYTPPGTATQPVLEEAVTSYKGTSNFTRYTLTLSAPVESITLHIGSFDFMRTRFTGNHREQLLSGGTELVYDPATRQLYDIAPQTVLNVSRDGYGSVRITGTNGLPLTQIVFEKYDDPNSTSTGDGYFYTFSVVPACDTDGDGIPNRLDLDSDGDGCSDALEGGASFTLANLVPATGTISTQSPNQNLGNTVGNTTTTMGVPTIAGTGQTVGQSQNFLLNDCKDSDADGIPDWQDLDDDNDGILDATEDCSYLAQNTSGAWKGQTNSTVSVTSVGSLTATAFTTNDLQNNYYVNQNGAEQWIRATGGVTYQINFSPAVPASEIAYYIREQSVGANHTFKISVNGGNPNNTFFSTPVGVGATIYLNYNPITGDISRANTSGTVEHIMLKGTGNTLVSSIQITGSGIGASEIFDFSIFAKKICDADLDGIPNYLDLDSDGDGCSDAIEGGADITVNQLVTAGGTVTGGSTAVNQNLCVTGACVNAQGVPQLSPLPTGYSNTTGQTIGDSQNALVNACYCYKKPVLNAGVTVPTRHGITALNRANSGATDWPIVRQSAWTVLESKTKGFVVNRVAFNNAVTPPVPVGIAAANFVEGMMVYDTTNNCLKIYNGTAWNCYTSQACPQ